MTCTDMTQHLCKGCRRRHCCEDCGHCVVCDHNELVFSVYNCSDDVDLTYENQYWECRDTVEYSSQSFLCKPSMGTGWYLNTFDISFYDLLGKQREKFYNYLTNIPFASLEKQFCGPETFAESSGKIPVHQTCIFAEIQLSIIQILIDTS